MKEFDPGDNAASIASVTDRVRHRTFVLRAGHHYLASPR